MKLFSLDEPELQFAQAAHICPRSGITRYGVYDSLQQSRRERIHIGVVGNSQGLEKVYRWLEICSREITGKPADPHPNLFPSFCGFNRQSGFKADFLVSSEIARQIANSDLKSINKVVLWNQRVEAAVDLYYREVKFLVQNRTVDVIVCVVPDSLYSKVAIDAEAEAGDVGEDPSERSDEQQPGTDEHEDEDEEELNELEVNFRRMLKARTMALGRPIQIVREHSLGLDVADQQDGATKAWNFCTALYYKSGQTIPWKMVTDRNRPPVCAVGISFYRSRDRQTLNTSLAQIFDELGNGLILRGTAVQQDKVDRRPFLSAEQAADLIARALAEYRDAVRTMPARLVIHKSSKFRQCELDGIRQATKGAGVSAVDFVTVSPSRMRLFRGKPYPPYRGTRIELEPGLQLLYTRGSVPYYSTYTGKYLPEPLELRIVESEESPAILSQEILALTKMNWNNTQFDGKFPVTIACARKVGEILKYLPPHESPQIRYSFYM
jgi:hypothetical protein